mgnify:CR=1 FL=1
MDTDTQKASVTILNIGKSGIYPIALNRLKNMRISSRNGFRDTYTRYIQEADYETFSFCFID